MKIFYNKSCNGIKPAGHRGQSGHDKPTPEALTYPPINIKTKSIESVEKERVLRNIIIVFSSCLVVFFFLFLLLVLNSASYIIIVLLKFLSCMDGLYNRMGVLQHQHLQFLTP